MANKFKSKGLVFKFGATNPPTGTVANCGDGTLNFGEREAAIDVTTHDNSTGEVEKMDNGFKEPFSFDGELLWDPDDATHEAIRAAQASGATHYAQFSFPNTGAAVITGSVRVKSMSVPVPVKGKLSAQVSLEGMGTTTYAQ